MKENIIIFLKGFVIGIGKIIPGVSGAVIAISLGVYERLIEAVANIFNFKEYKFLIIITSGIISSIIITSGLISYLLNNYYFSIMLLFCGMIFGSIYQNIKEKSLEINFKNITLVLIPSLIIFLLFLFTKGNLKLESNFTTLFFLGIIEAITMIIPGISGSAILMMLGMYDLIISSLSSFLNFYVLFPFFIGIISGIILLCNMLNKLLKKHSNECYYIVIGFSLTSGIILLRNIFIMSASLINYIVGIILFILGFLLTRKTN